MGLVSQTRLDEIKSDGSLVPELGCLTRAGQSPSRGRVEEYTPGEVWLKSAGVGGGERAGVEG